MATLRAFEPYALFFAELCHRASGSDCALKASVALRRARNRTVNAIFAHVLADGARSPRARAFIAETLS